MYLCYHPPWLSPTLALSDQVTSDMHTLSIFPRDAIAPGVIIPLGSSAWKKDVNCRGLRCYLRYHHHPPLWSVACVPSAYETLPLVLLSRPADITPHQEPPPGDKKARLEKIKSTSLSDLLTSFVFCSISEYVLFWCLFVLIFWSCLCCFLVR